MAQNNGDFWQGLIRGLFGQGQDQQQQQGQQGQQQNRPRPQPQRQFIAPAGGGGVHPFAAHSNAHREMYRNTQAAISNEMESRRRQAERERERQHELQIESVRQQGKQQQQYYRLPEQAELNDQYRQQFNRGLLNSAGLGGHSVMTDGKGGVRHIPHTFAPSPVTASLFGW